MRTDEMVADEPRSLFAKGPGRGGVFGFAEPRTLSEHLSEYKSDDGYEPESLARPTDTKPGTWEKVEEMRKRLENDTHLWHPQDAKEDCRSNEYSDLIGANWEDLA